MRENKIIISKVLRRVRPYWGHLILSLLLALLYVAMSLYIPILVGDAIDGIRETGVDFECVMENLLAVCVCAAVAGLSQWLMNLLCNRVTFRITRDLREEAFAHIQVLPLSYLDSHPRGDLVSRVVSDADTFADGLLMGFNQLFTGVMTIAGTLIFMLRISIPVALVVIVITPLSLVVANFIAKSTHSMFFAQAKSRGSQTALIDEAIGNLKLVRAFGHEAAILEQFDTVNEELEKMAFRAFFSSSALTASNSSMISSS